MKPQLTNPKTCQQKRTYWSAQTAKRAKKRRNKAAGINYLRHYKCDLGDHWHLTTQKLDNEARLNKTIEE